MDVDTRFWSKVDKTDTCWLWTGSLNSPGGYGQFYVGGGRKNPKKVSAHVWAWEQENGPVEDGKELDHRCLIKHCVRPSHLREVTHKQNCEYRSEVQTKCKRASHEYTEENTYRDKRGKRQCRTCIKGRKHDSKN